MCVDNERSSDLKVENLMIPHCISTASYQSSEYIIKYHTKIVGEELVPLTCLIDIIARSNLELFVC